MTELQRLKFAEGMLVLVETGQMTSTIRRHKPGINDFASGEVFIGEFDEGVDLTLRATAPTTTKLLRNLMNTEARANGYQDVHDAWIGLQAFYPDLQLTDVVAIIHFEIYPETFVSRSPFMQGELALRNVTICTTHGYTSSDANDRCPTCWTESGAM